MAEQSLHLPTGPVLWKLESHGQERYPPGRRYWYENEHRQPFGVCTLQLTLSGAVVYREHRRDHMVPAGHAMLFAQGESTAYGLTSAQSQPYVCRWINLAGAGLVEHWNAVRNRHGSVLDFNGSDITQRLSELIALVSLRVPSEVTSMARSISDFVYWLIDWAEKSRASRQSSVERAVDQLLRQSTLALSLKTVAHMHGCSREHLGREFRKRVGQAPGAYLAQARLQHALRLIASTQLPIKAVAQQAGFVSPHTLVRRVRQATGTSPMGYRELVQHRA